MLLSITAELLNIISKKYSHSIIFTKNIFALFNDRIFVTKKGDDFYTEKAVLCHFSRVVSTTELKHIIDRV